MRYNKNYQVLSDRIANTREYSTTGSMVLVTVILLGVFCYSDPIQHCTWLVHRKSTKNVTWNVDNTICQLGNTVVVLVAYRSLMYGFYCHRICFPATWFRYDSIQRSLLRYVAKRAVFLVVLGAMCYGKKLLQTLSFNHA
jgi:hypothetical protein